MCYQCKSGVCTEGGGWQPPSIDAGAPVQEAASAPGSKTQTGKCKEVGYGEPPRWRQIKERPVTQGLGPSLRYRPGTKEKGQDQGEEPEGGRGAWTG